MSKRNYGANDIDMLDEIESIRRKAGMYCGDLGVNGLHHLVWEVISNSADEALNGNGNHITVVLHEDDFVEVIDNGSGIPVGHNDKFNMSALDLIMLFKHSGGKLKPEETTYTKGSIGTNGLGLFITNCLSNPIIVTSRRDKGVWQATYAQGKKVSEVKKIGDLLRNDTGTSIKWKVDPTVFVYNREYERDRFETKLQMLSYMIPKVTIEFKDLRNPDKPFTTKYYSENGLIDMLNHRTAGSSKIFKAPIHVNETVEHNAIKFDLNGTQFNAIQHIGVEICFTYEPIVREERVSTFVNGNDIPLGGTCVTGFRRGLLKAINEFARENNILKDKDMDFKSSEIKEGLVACIHITHPDPQFDGQTKVKINNQELDGYCNSIIYNKLYRLGIDNPKDMFKLCDFLFRLRKGREASAKALDNELRKIIQPQTKNSVNMSDFVVDASSSNRAECELYIIEGQSAMGSGKDARDSKFQALFPLRGKLINTYKGELKDILKNREVQGLLKVMGTGSTHSNQFDINKSRYGKIVIMSDADVKIKTPEQIQSASA